MGFQLAFEISQASSESVFHYLVARIRNERN